MIKKRLFILFTLLIVLYFCFSKTDPWDDKTDPWDEMYPFWGERPGEKSRSFYHRYKNTTFPVHLIIGENESLLQKITNENYIMDLPNDVDTSIANIYPTKSYTVWRSREVVDFAGTRYQAVKPTYILFNTGDCIIYLYDWYTMDTMDALPPPAKVIEPRFVK